MTSPSVAEPERLLELARTGKSAALGQLLARLQIGRRLQGKAVPANLVQETFRPTCWWRARLRQRREAICGSPTSAWPSARDSRA